MCFLKSALAHKEVEISSAFAPVGSKKEITEDILSHETDSFEE